MEQYRQAKEAAEHDLKQLKKLEGLRDDLTQMIVHDMRTPMTSFIGGLEVMQMWGDLSARQRNCLTISLRGGAALVAMINDLLDVSKMEAGLLRLNLQEVQLEEPVAVVRQQVVQLAEPVRPQAGNRNRARPAAAARRFGQVAAHADELVQQLDQVHARGRRNRFVGAPKR